MKQIIVFLFAIFMATSSVVNAQTSNQKEDTTKKEVPTAWTDVSLFDIDKIKESTTTPLIWYTHDNGKYYIESRVNFDWAMTAGVFAGKTFSKNDKFWITPKFGCLFSFNKEGYNGLSPEFNFGGSVGKFRYFTMSQCAVSLNPEKNPSYLYGYYEAGYQLPYVKIGYASQFFHPTDQSKTWTDQGPFMVISYKEFYLKPWYTWDPSRNVQKFIVGLGYHY